MFEYYWTQSSPCSHNCTRARTVECPSNQLSLLVPSYSWKLSRFLFSSKNKQCKARLNYISPSHKPSRPPLLLDNFSEPQPRLYLHQHLHKPPEIKFIIFVLFFLSFFSSLSSIFSPHSYGSIIFPLFWNCALLTSYCHW